jgi:hypothetical protein
MVAVKRLLLRYGRKPLTMKDFSISGPEGRKSLRETFLRGYPEIHDTNFRESAVTLR